MREELISKVEGFLEGSLTADELDSWITRHLQTILDSGDNEAIALEEQVSGGLGVWNAGDISRDEMLSQLREVLARTRSAAA